MFGFINVCKPKGITSHDVISVLRKVTKIKQIGHAGTLDPFAEGVLPVAIGTATRLIEYLPSQKEYVAEITFGASTTSYDIDGDFVEKSDITVKKEDLEKVLTDFRGEITQIPPIFSAIKVGGKKLYEYAREGKKVEIEPRKVKIELINIVDFDEKKQIATIIIRCSKGTYIRSIAHDIGQKLKCGAYLSKLTRTQSGKFKIKNSVKLDEIKDIETVEKVLINPLDVLDFPTKNLNNDEYKKVTFGQTLNNTDFKDGEIVLLTKENHLVAVARVKENLIVMQKVFGL